MTLPDYSKKKICKEYLYTKSICVSVGASI